MDFLVERVDVWAAGVWLGFPLADPIMGLLITIAVFVIVWQSSKSIFSRMLDGVGRFYNPNHFDPTPACR